MCATIETLATKKIILRGVYSIDCLLYAASRLVGTPGEADLQLQVMLKREYVNSDVGANFDHIKAYAEREALALADWAAWPSSKIDRRVIRFILFR